MVLLDLKLPKVTGLQVLQWVRADPRTKELPVVILTSFEDDREVVEILPARSDGYLVKPLNKDEFCSLAQKLGLGSGTQPQNPELHPRPTAHAPERTEIPNPNPKDLGSQILGCQAARNSCKRSQSEVDRLQGVDPLAVRVEQRPRGREVRKRLVALPGRRERTAPRAARRPFEREEGRDVAEAVLGQRQDRLLAEEAVEATAAPGEMAPAEGVSAVAPPERLERLLDAVPSRRTRAPAGRAELLEERVPRRPSWAGDDARNWRIRTWPPSTRRSPCR
jgi:CheY-like chemotaxis protein